MGIKNFTGANPPVDNGGNNGGSGDDTGGLGGLGAFFAAIGGNGGPSGPQDDGFDPTEWLLNYNEQFKQAGPTLFRDAIVLQTMGVLISKNKPNVILTGPAGVGKTKIVEDIAYRIANDDPMVPDKLKGCVIYELPLSNIVAGSKYVGDLESKLQAVINFIENPDNKAILFIDEIHQLANTNEPSYQKMAQILKPALARGKLHTIGATTTQEAKNLADDPAFNRRFTKILVDELTAEQTVEILIAAKAGFLAHHNYGIALNDSMMKTVVELADEYRPAGSHRPDNALTLLDRAISDAIMTRKKQETLLTKDPTMQHALQALKAIKQIPVTDRQLKHTAIALASGNSKPETLDVNALRNALSAIKGQDQIVETLIEELRRHELNLIPSSKPLVILFSGPSGTGKTETTKIIANAIMGCPPITLNMTEYSDPTTVNKIIGSSAGYVGYDSNAEMPFDALESNPYQIILLDEFEKCHEAVKRLFMQIFDEGCLKTNRGNTIDFSRAIIIVTTNAGHTKVKTQMGFGSHTTASVNTKVKDLIGSFDTALINRFRVRLTFNPIDEATYRDILISNYARMRDIVLKRQPYAKLPDEIPDDELDDIVSATYEPELNARPAVAAIEDYIYSRVL